jgi:hypothetical protein
VLHNQGLPTKELQMIFTVMGFTVSSAEQARSILLVAMLNGNKEVAKQCCSVISMFEAA